MKKVFLMLLITQSAIALDCEEQNFQGNLSWLNPFEHTNTTSELTEDFRGGNCEDQVFVANVPEGGEVDYAYFLPELDTNVSGYNYSFAIDFAEVLSLISTGNRVTFFELWAKGDPVGDGIETEAKNMLIRIKKKPLSNGDFKWKVHLMWYSFPENGPVQQYTKDHVWLPSDIHQGLLYFMVNTNNSVNGGTQTRVSVHSGLTRIDSNYEEQPVLLDISPYANQKPDPSELKEFHTFVSPFKTNTLRVSEARLGIISHDSGVNIGDGITFHTPYRPPSGKN